MSSTAMPMWWSFKALRASHHAEDPGDAVQQPEALHALDLQPPRDQLADDAAAGLVDVDGHPQRPDLEARQLQDRVGVGGDRELPAVGEPVAHAEVAALEVEGRRLAGVSRGDADPRPQPV